ncbi:MAG: DNA cytosine methyltransferase [Prevotella sp.]|jgi:DNA (cytosine-5)-methyltransferase 1|nr:DNA cytosine methyltransferase [Prevotella sp.]
MKRKYTFIDLFAGAGGLSEGFERAGYQPLAHIEMNKAACDTLRTRAVYHYLYQKGQLDVYENYLKNKKDISCETFWGKAPQSITDTVIQAEIKDETLPNIFEIVDTLCGGRHVDLIIGGPPCQAYSVVGRSRVGKEAIKSDPRNELYKYYVQFLERYKPSMFVFENVMGILSAKGGEPFRDLCHRVRNLGLDYEIEAKECIASNYGVLQHRHRYIIVGWRKKIDGHETGLHYPELDEVKHGYNILNDLFSDLPSRKSGEGSLLGIVRYTRPLSSMEYLEKAGIRGKIGFTTQHVARPNNRNDLDIYYMAVTMYNKGKRLKYTDIPADHQTHKNTKSFLDRFRVVNGNGCSHTLVAHIAKDGHYYIYPTPNPTPDNVRSITVREAARIQSFPDDYFFEGSRSDAFKQIGNAVPVLLAYTIALAILKELDLWSMRK